MKKYTYVPGAFIAVWLIWELIVRLGGFNEALLPTPYKVLLGFGELIGDGVLFKDIADSLVGIRGFGTTSIQSSKSFDQFLLWRGYRLSFYSSVSVKHRLS